MQTLKVDLLENKTSDSKILFYFTFSTFPPV